MSKTTYPDSPVVIAGGGTVGLAMATFLAHRGLAPLVFERRERPSQHPRALGIAARTLEIFRSVGLGAAMDAAAVRCAAPGKTSARTLTHIQRAATPPPPHAGSNLYPEAPLGHYPQDRIDAVLLPAARQYGAEVTFGTGVAGVNQDEHGVDVTLSDGRTLRTQYLIGADGVNSTVRAPLGITTTGPGELTGGDPTLNILFEADLIACFGPLPMMIDITHPGATGLLLCVGERRWVMHTKPPAGGAFTTQTCADSIRLALGEDAPFTIISVAPWRATVRLAEQFRCGRGFVVGDAARAVSPLGAFGLNTGIADAHNLAWKMAMVVRGQAGDALLDSYHDERHAVSQMVTEQTRLRWAHPRLHWDQGAVPERAAVGAWNAPMVTMGYRYDSSAIIDAVAALPSTEDVSASLDGAPGSHLAHRWVGGRSTLDLIGSGFTLLTASGEWDQAASDLELPVVRLDHDWATSVGIGPSGALLVRPDGFIAWRSPTPQTSRLAEMLTSITSR